MGELVAQFTKYLVFVFLECLFKVVEFQVLEQLLHVFVLEVQTVGSFVLFGQKDARFIPFHPLKALKHFFRVVLDLRSCPTAKKTFKRIDCLFLFGTGGVFGFDVDLKFVGRKVDFGPLFFGLFVFLTFDDELFFMEETLAGDGFLEESDGGSGEFLDEHGFGGRGFGDEEGFVGMGDFVDFVDVA